MALVRTILCGTASIASACALERYEAKPLDVDAVVQELEEGREHARVGLESLTLDDVEELALERSAPLREAAAAFRASLALDDVKARLLDPEVGVGVNSAIGSGVDRRPVAPAVSASVSVPLTSRRPREDARDLATVRLAAARVDRAARLAVLDARRAFVEAALARERVDGREEVVAILREAARSTRGLVASGAASALDVAVVELQVARAEQARFDAEQDRQRADADLARALLLDPSDLSSLALVVPVANGWLGRDLNRLRGRSDVAIVARQYDLAEAQLALEIARQVSDLAIGASLQPEPAEAFTIVGVMLSSLVPLFRRNAQAIAVAKARRDEVRARYGVALDRARSDASAARAALERAQARVAFLREETLPAAESVVDIAARSVETGSVAPLSLLSAARTRAELRFEALLARQASLLARLDLERALESRAIGDPNEPFATHADVAAWRDRMQESAR